MSILIKLTRLKPVPTESYNKKVKDFTENLLNQDDMEPKEGSAEWYRDMGIEPPEGVEDKRSEDYIEISEDDYDYIEVDHYPMYNKINHIEEVKESLLLKNNIHSVISYIDGEKIFLKETAEDIATKINKNFLKINK